MKASWFGLFYFYYTIKNSNRKVEKIEEINNSNKDEEKNKNSRDSYKINFTNKTKNID